LSDNKFTYNPRIIGVFINYMILCVNSVFRVNGSKNGSKSFTRYPETAGDLKDDWQ